MTYSRIIRLIIQNYVETSNCFHIISRDGITTDQFAISRSKPLFVNASLSIRQVRLQIPSIGRSVSLAKNLDYYQNKICHEIPSIPDTKQIKRMLQILRVVIIALFIKLNKLMVEKYTSTSLECDKYFVDWNHYSEQVLSTTSRILFDRTETNTKEEILDTIKGTLDYLGTSKSLIDNELSYLY